MFHRVVATRLSVHYVSFFSISNTEHLGILPITFPRQHDSGYSIILQNLGTVERVGIKLINIPLPNRIN